MRHLITIATAVAALTTLTSCNSQEAAETTALDFNPDDFTAASLVMPSGDTVEYRAYEGIYYVTNVEDS
ncbi:MAG: alpha/beta hydrolase, partial [Paramuribaculum sp.]|nr:alpha/beta hydrolase [Paramuribaculum sp.]